MGQRRAIVSSGAFGGGTLGRSSGDFGREHLRSLGRRLRELREARSWSLKRLSSESGVSIAAIQKIESGETNPNLLTVLSIADDSQAGAEHAGNASKTTLNSVTAAL